MTAPLSDRTPMASRYWRTSEEHTLRKTLHLPALEVAAMLGRTEDAVNCRRYFLGLTRKGRTGRRPLPVAPLADYPALGWLADRLAHPQQMPALIEE